MGSIRTPMVANMMGNGKILKQRDAVDFGLRIEFLLKEDGHGKQEKKEFRIIMSSKIVSTPLHLKRRRILVLILLF